MIQGINTSLKELELQSTEAMRVQISLKFSMKPKPKGFLIIVHHKKLLDQEIGNMIVI